MEQSLSASEHVRYHESAHAVAAVRLDIGLEELAIVLKSDNDAWVNAKNDPCDEEDLNDWTIRRLAVKLAGPIARILQNGEVLTWDTMSSSGEYHTDFECAKKCCFGYLKIPEVNSENSTVDHMMNLAADRAIRCVESNHAEISALTNSTVNKDYFSRAEVIAVIAA